MNKKINLIVTSAILALALVVAIITGIQFANFSNFDTQFYTDNADAVFMYSDFSPNLKGTAGDAEIYAFYGTENTVAVVKASNADKFATDIPAGTKIYYVDGQAAQLAAAQATLGNDYTYEAISADQVASVLDENSVVIMKYGTAKTITNETVVVAGAEVEKVPSVLVLGGTHPNEPSGQLTATIFLENAQVERGNLYVVTENNKSAYTHSQPQEASAWYFDFELADGSTRTFKYGSRATNTVDQWPTPDVYAHSSGQKLSSTEVRNLNRAYPGNANGTYTEQVAWAVTNFVITNDITIVIDLHEASPEYAVNNACVYHQDSEDLYAKMKIGGFKGIKGSKNLKDAHGNSPSSNKIKGEYSAPGLHGLTHRELGDFTNAYVFLFETSNASQGKLHGAFVPELIAYEGYTDKFYEYAWKQTQSGKNDLLEAPAASISERVARHTDSIMTVINAFNEIEVTRNKHSVDLGYFNNKYVEAAPSVNVGKFVINNIPSYENIFVNGVAAYLQSVAK